MTMTYYVEVRILREVHDAEGTKIHEGIIEPFTILGPLKSLRSAKRVVLMVKDLLM